eukprot:363565-Chlamydomonas_euryale.AAC.10
METTARRLRLQVWMNSNELQARSMLLALNAMERMRIATRRRSIAPLEYSNHHLCGRRPHVSIWCITSARLELTDLARLDEA